VNGDTSSVSRHRGASSTSVSSLPNDYSSIPDKDLTFAFIYQEVLRYYHVLYPAMRAVFSLADEHEVTKRADAIRNDRSKDLAKWSHMPRTREMSAGSGNCSPVAGEGSKLTEALLKLQRHLYSRIFIVVQGPSADTNRISYRNRPLRMLGPLASRTALEQGDVEPFVLNMSENMVCCASAKPIAFETKN